jgi:hypothetical protein
MLIHGIGIAWADDVSGTYTKVLKESVTPELRADVREQAVDSLRYELRLWLDENMQTPPDLTDPLTKHFLGIFADSCVKRAKEESFIEEREWFYRLSLSDRDIRSIIDRHNGRYDSLSRHYWKLASEGLKFGRSPVVFSGCTHTLFYGSAHIQLLGHEPAEALQTARATAREELQKTLDQVMVSFSEPIITGKPGTPIEKNVTATAGLIETKEQSEQVEDENGNPQTITTITYDTIPFPGLPITGRLPDGRKVFTIRTASNGMASVGTIDMPFVAHGAFLHTHTDLGAVVDPGLSFTPDAFGLETPEGHDQSLMFNLIRPVFVLEYQVTAANEIDIPGDFRSKTTIEKFLKDSCHMVPKQGTRPADFSIDITCQVSSYASDEDELTHLKVEAAGSVKHLTVDGARVEQAKVLHQKSYETGMTVPTGLFFWESTNALRGFIRELLKEI